MDKMISQTLLCLSSFLDEERGSTIWKLDQFSDVRSHLSRIVSNPDKYPFDADHWGDGRDRLTKDIAKDLRSRSIEPQLVQATGDDDKALYIQISSVKCDKREAGRYHGNK